MEENKINALMDMTVSKIRQLVDADTIIGKPISTPDGITVIPVSRMSFGIGTGGTTGSKGISFTGGNGAGVKVEDINKLLKQFDMMNQMMKQFSGPGAAKKMKRMGKFGGMGGLGGFPGL